jgi:hypothetical protein
MDPARVLCRNPYWAFLDSLVIDPGTIAGDDENHDFIWDDVERCLARHYYLPEESRQYQRSYVLQLQKLLSEHADKERSILNYAELVWLNSCNPGFNYKHHEALKGCVISGMKREMAYKFVNRLVLKDHREMRRECDEDSEIGRLEKKKGPR